MTTLKSSVRRGLVVTAAAAVAGPLAAAAASAAPPARRPRSGRHRAPGERRHAADRRSRGDSASQAADTIPVGRAASASPLSSLAGLPVAGPLAGQLPVMGPVSGLAGPLLSASAAACPSPASGVRPAGRPAAGRRDGRGRARARRHHRPATRSALPAHQPLLMPAPDLNPGKPALSRTRRSRPRPAGRAAPGEARRPGGRGSGARHRAGAVGALRPADVVALPLGGTPAALRR